MLMQTESLMLLHCDYAETNYYFILYFAPFLFDYIFGSINDQNERFVGFSLKMQGLILKKILAGKAI